MEDTSAKCRGRMSQVLPHFCISGQVDPSLGTRFPPVDESYGESGRHAPPGPTDSSLRIPAGTGEAVNSSSGYRILVPGDAGAVHDRPTRSFQTKNISEPFSSWCALLFDVLKDEDCGEEVGGALWAAVQLGQDLPVLEGGDGAFADASAAGVGAVDGLLVA